MVRYIPENKTAAGINIVSHSGDGSTTTFAITSGMTTNKLQVSLNGLIQSPGTDFTVVGSNVIFGAGAPEVTDTITITELPI